MFATDALRIAEFCDLYEHGGLDDEARFALMEVIIESVNDALLLTCDKSLLARFEGLLTRDFVLNFHTVRYWCVFGETDPDNVFEVTPIMRQVWNQCFRSEYAAWMD